MFIRLWLSRHVLNNRMLMHSFLKITFFLLQAYRIFLLVCLKMLRVDERDFLLRILKYETRTMAYYNKRSPFVKHTRIYMAHTYTYFTLSTESQFQILCILILCSSENRGHVTRNVCIIMRIYSWCHSWFTYPLSYYLKCDSSTSYRVISCALSPLLCTPRTFYDIVNIYMKDDKYKSSSLLVSLSVTHPVYNNRSCVRPVPYIFCYARLFLIFSSFKWVNEYLLP